MDSETVWVAVTVAVSTISVGVGSPVILAWLRGRQEAAVIEARNEREDKLIAARQAREDQVAKDLRDRQDEISRRTAEVASVLERTTASTEQKLAALQDGQTQIHTLVNSNMTHTKTEVLIALEVALALMLELFALKEAAAAVATDGERDAIQDGQATLTARIRTTRERIAALKAELSDRLKVA